MCRKKAFYRCWAIFLPTFEGSRDLGPVGIWKVAKGLNIQGTIRAVAAASFAASSVFLDRFRRCLMGQEGDSIAAEDIQNNNHGGSIRSAVEGWPSVYALARACGGASCFASGVSGVCKHKVLAGYPKVLKVAV